MFKIKSLILLLVSFAFISCSKDNSRKFEQKYSLGYIGGEYEGLILKNYISNNLSNFGLYDENSDLEIKPSISHSSSIYITNIDNTSDRMKVESRLVAKIFDRKLQCVVFNFEESLSQFYLFADSLRYISNNRAEKKIKEQNTEELVKKFINKLMRSKNECKMNDE